MGSARFRDVLAVLAAHDVEFILVGQLSAVVQGAPVTTFGVDIVHRRTPENVERLLAALGELDASSRLDRRGLRPTADHLSGPEHQLLQTRLGDLDCLGAIDGERGDDELLAESLVMSLGEGHTIRVLRLSTLIDVKRRAGRPKDLAALPALCATLEELERAGRGEG
jgi:hypothetical protein